MTWSSWPVTAMPLRWGFLRGVMSPPCPIPATRSAARGDTVHGVLNFLGLINKTPVFDTAAWTVEFSWCRWDKVTQNEAVFKGRPDYTAIDRVSKDAFGVDAHLHTYLVSGFSVGGSLGANHLWSWPERQRGDRRRHQRRTRATTASG